MEQEEDDNAAAAVPDPLAGVLELSTMYARPLYAFQRDERGSLTREIVPLNVNAQLGKASAAIDTWVVSVFFRIVGNEAGVTRLLTLCREEPAWPLSRLMFLLKPHAPGVSEEASLRESWFPFSVSEIRLGDLDLALRRAVNAVPGAQPLTLKEETEALLRCPYVLVNWVLAFGTHQRAADYIELCNTPHEPNWMHTLLADFGRFAGEAFNPHKKACPIAINTEKTLKRAPALRSNGGAANVIPLDAIYGTPRCLYTTIYVVPAYDPAVSEELIQATFAGTHNDGTRRLSRGLEVHRTVFMDPAVMRTLRFGFLSKEAPGLEQFSLQLSYRLPVNLVAYYDAICRFYFDALFHNDRVQGLFDLESSPFVWAQTGDRYHGISLMPRIMIGDTIYDFPHLVPLDAQGQAVAYLQPSTLSALVSSQFYPSLSHGTLNL